MKYEILKSDTVFGLEGIVKNYISMGYSVTGGVSVVILNDTPRGRIPNLLFFQAVVDSTTAVNEVLR